MLWKGSTRKKHEKYYTLTASKIFLSALVCAVSFWFVTMDAFFKTFMAKCLLASRPAVFRTYNERKEKNINMLVQKDLAGRAYTRNISTRILFRKYHLIVFVYRQQIVYCSSFLAIYFFLYIFFFVSNLRLLSFIINT